ncbi:hypothetical protein P154DRAFT_606539 [Amniculicola lignicola CBS 123094]|uniref:BTB domain-containing protein n=1 Tax=Amniculicola lignicola CBS 123094 TaxID=1392246 RepID=A0A6A5W919_9PLEO|nr:hypothetical protein P154DRAFT_606539 [Amniculicola lignicola CBS 123094]
MANVVHKVVSNVDTIIVLKNPALRFAVWDEDASSQTDDGTERVSAHVLVEEQGEEPIEEEGIQFHVCAGNLMSASPWFNRALKKDGWMEGNREGEDRQHRLSAEGWDEEAFKILMNVFHLRHRKIPQSVSLEMLAKIAVLVDYYECSEAIELYTNMWITHLKENAPVPETYCRDLILWIWVAWAFQLSDPYQEATATAIKQSNECVRNLGLPIPDTITDEIDLRRLQAIEDIVSRLHELLDGYRSATYSCAVGNVYSFQCGSMLLGALTKQLDEAKLLSPRLEVPFAERSFGDICGTVRLMTSPGWIHRKGSGLHTCSLATTLESCIDTVTGTKGLSWTTMRTERDDECN